MSPRYIGSLPFKPPIPPERIFPNASHDAVDLLQKMLVFHPGKRIAVEDCLAHPYLASLHDPSDEPLAHAEFSFDFERMPLTKQVLRDLLSNEMLCFHPELREDAQYSRLQPGVQHAGACSALADTDTMDEA